MEIMFTTSKNKNSVINFERNQLKNQKPQNPIGPKISPKMHEKCMKYVKKNEKEGVKRSYWHLKTKTLRKNRKKTTKIDLKWIGQREREQNAF